MRSILHGGNSERAALAIQLSRAIPDKSALSHRRLRWARFRPYKVGDWLHVGEHFAEVMEINWRSTRLRTNDAIYLDIPNNEIVRTTIINLHYPSEVHAMRIRVGIDYNVPPNRVKDALARAAQSAKNVLRDPR